MVTDGPAAALVAGLAAPLKGHPTAFCNKPTDEPNNHVVWENFTFAGEPSAKACRGSLFYISGIWA